MILFLKWIPQLMVLCAILIVYIIPAVSGLEVQIPVPRGQTYLPFQKESIVGLARSNRILLADEMGLGKTISVIGALNFLRNSSNSTASSIQRVLIICPKSVLPNWKWELQHWLVDEEEEWTIGTATAEKGLPGDRTNILLMNYDIVDKYRHDLDSDWGPFDILVCDEAHFLKNSEAIRTRAILGSLGSITQQKLDGKHRKGLATKRLWLLTGSPLLNNPSELYTLLKSIDPECQVIPELSSLPEFCNHYSNKREAPWGTTYWGGRNLVELRQRLHTARTEQDGTPLMIRRTKSQVLNDLPPKRHQLLPLLDHDSKVATEEWERVQLALQKLTERIEHRSQQPLANKTVVELKALLKNHTLKVSGTKKELIERLREHNVVPPVAQDEEIPKNTTTNPDELLDELPDDDDESTILNGDTNNLDVHSSAESALRSPRHLGQLGSASVLQQVLGNLHRQGVDTTKTDMDSIRGLLACARHETARMKVPHAIELIENSIESHKVIVFAYHRDVQTELREAFGAKAVGIIGGDSLEERSEAVQRFQNDPSVRVFVGSIKAAGTGITLSSASHVIFVEMDWSPLVMQQAEDRCHRIGQKSSVLVQYLFFPNTIDEYVAELLASKQSTITAAIDEATGAASWIFDFGKHKGVSVGDVAGCDPNYLEWLVETSAILARKPKLALALKELGFLSMDATTNNERDPLTVKVPEKKTHENSEEILSTRMIIDRIAQKKDGILSKSGSYVMTFGKYKGENLADIPTGYLHWLRSSGATRRNPAMAMCLNKHLAERKQ